jgi:hypothetical protein
MSLMGYHNGESENKMGMLPLELVEAAYLARLYIDQLTLR